MISSGGMMKFPTEWKNKIHVPHHQTDQQSSHNHPITASSVDANDGGNAVQSASDLSEGEVTATFGGFHTWRYPKMDGLSFKKY